MIATRAGESVCILGGSGFVGRSLAVRLCAQGRRVRVITRDRQRSRHLLVMPTIEVVDGNPHDEAALAGHFEGMDAVVNLVAILHERRNQKFHDVHVELPRKVANACRAAGVPRLLHMSALGASVDAASNYLRTRAEGEAAVKEALGATALTIFRPSVIFGRGDSFLRLFAGLARRFPVLPLAMPEARFQPVWVEDVTRALALALDRDETIGNTYGLCGPQVFTLREIVAFVAAASGQPRPILGLPDALAWLQAFVFEHLPGPIMTRDNLRSMQSDNVCEGPFAEVFGFAPAAMQAVALEYLALAGARGRHDGYRIRAGR